MRLLQFQLKYSCVCSAWSLLELLIFLGLMAILASLGLPQIYSAWLLQSVHDERQ
jgi:Tfp pilus assembly protein FimT